MIDTEGLLASLSMTIVFSGIAFLLVGIGLILGGVFWKKQPQLTA